MRADHGGWERLTWRLLALAALFRVSFLDAGRLGPCAACLSLGLSPSNTRGTGRPADASRASEEERGSLLAYVMLALSTVLPAAWAVLAVSEESARSLSEGTPGSATARRELLFSDTWDQ